VHPIPGYSGGPGCQLIAPFVALSSKELGIIQGDKYENI
jgi:hypothetical protein